MNHIATKIFVVFLSLLLASKLPAQYILSGKVTNTSNEPVPYATVSITETKNSTLTNAKGEYKLNVAEGKYNLAITNTGYKPLLISIIVNGKDLVENVILESKTQQGQDATIIAFRKDRWAEVMKNLIKNKDNYLAATQTYTAKMYIRATEENEKTVFKKRKPNDSLEPKKQTDLSKMSMAELLVKLDKNGSEKTKETRLGVKLRGNTDNLFYLQTTDGDFSLYNNLIKVPALCDVPMLSPVSNAGLNAYDFKTIRVRKNNGRRFYTIKFTPVKAGNALIEGEMEVMDSLWVITRTNYSFPNYLLQQYDYFGVEQEYDTTYSSVYMLQKQDLTYVSKLGNNAKTGRTLVTYSDYEMDPSFAKKYFSNEVIVTTQQAYEQDSSFWEQVRQEPLSAEQLAFIRYHDSVARVKSSKAYTDSIDAIFNKITLGKILLQGQGFYNRKNERTFFMEPVINIVQPFQFAGTRLKFDYDYTKTYGSRKNEHIWGHISYGFKNSDFKGELKIRKLYNTFKRSAYEINIGRQFSSLFATGSWDQQLDRSGIFERDDIGITHETELLNGLFLRTGAEVSFRRDATRYKIVDERIVIIKNILEINPNQRPVSFNAYHGIFSDISLSYTPGQKYIREPREKIILGSNWPTLSVQWRKALDVFGSKVNFDYLEYKIAQTKNIGLLGTLQYSATTGKYVNQKKIEIPDNKYIRRKDPFFFLNPTANFQGMDTSYALVNRFYEIHAMHNFNGFIINRIPFIKKLKLQEIAGAGYFYSVDNKLRYAEAYVGLEKIARIFKNKYKIGAYVVFSDANLFKTRPEFKFSFIKFHRRKGWY